MKRSGRAVCLSVAILSSTGCGGSQAPPHDRGASAEMRAPFAQCVGLPPEAVGIEVDAERRVIVVEWAEDAGDVSSGVLDACFERLGLMWADG